MQAFPKPIHLAHQFLRNVVNRGDIVVDATLGNGHDALFLAELVGKNGMVIGFDVQAAAIQSSEERMRFNAINHFQFHQLGHEKIAEVVESGVAAIVFNLGYLPNADKTVITLTETTLEALEAAISLLRVGGLVTVMCYPGHHGGDSESEAVRRWAAALKRDFFRVAHYQLLNAPNNPPFLITIEKCR